MTIRSREPDAGTGDAITKRQGKSYSYLPKKQKALVDKIVDQMERIRSVSQAYDKLELQNKVDGYYDDKPRERTPLSQQKEFRAIKNAVIKQAEHIWRCDLFFEDKGVEAESEPEDLEYCSRDYWDYRNDIYNADYSLEDRLMRSTTWNNWRERVTWMPSISWASCMRRAAADTGQCEGKILVSAGCATGTYVCAILSRQAPTLR